MFDSKEQVLVVPAKWIEAEHFLEEGFVIGDFIPENFVDRLIPECFFMDREAAETDENYRQIIPYVIVSCAERGGILTVTRANTQGEKRLHGKVSLGLGGHINPGDGLEDPIVSGLQRELMEELDIVEPPRMDEVVFIGVMLDSATEVERVHLGLVYSWDVPDYVKVRETDKMTGNFLQEKDLTPLLERMEGWSQAIYQELKFIRLHEDAGGVSDDTDVDG